MNFSLMFQTWINVLTQPGEAVFAQEREKPHATLSTALLWIVVTAVVGSLLSWVRSLLFVGLGGMGMVFQQMQQADMPPEMRDMMQGLLANGLFTGLAGGLGLIATVIFTPIFFLLGTGLFHLVARLLGGKGDFGRFAYLTATYGAPIQLLSALLGFVPLLGACVAVLLALYSLVLLFFAIKVEYSFSDGKSIGTIVLAIVAPMVVCGCAVVTLGGTIAALMGNFGK
jgi:hypothetical protein